MASNVDSFRDFIQPDVYRNSMQALLQHNPTIRNSALAGVVAANMVDFHGYVHVSDRETTFGENATRRAAKVFYISPYSGFWQDLFETIKRFFTGILFNPSNDNTTIRSCLDQGQRVTIVMATEGPEVERTLENNQKPLLDRLSELFSSCCCQSSTHSA